MPQSANGQSDDFGLPIDGMLTSGTSARFSTNSRRLAECHLFHCSRHAVLKVDLKRRHQLAWKRIGVKMYFHLQGLYGCSNIVINACATYACLVCDVTDTEHTHQTLNGNAKYKLCRWDETPNSYKNKQAGTLLAVFSLLLHVGCCSQHTREIVSARKPSHKHNNKDLSRLRYLWTRSVLLRSGPRSLSDCVDFLQKLDPKSTEKLVFRLAIHVDRAPDAFSFQYFQKVTVEHCYLSKHPSCPF